jgi:hypothetical protein
LYWYVLKGVYRLHARDVNELEKCGE